MDLSKYVLLGDNLTCASESCPHSRNCANHESAGDARREDGSKPNLTINNGVVHCDQATLDRTGFYTKGELLYGFDDDQADTLHSILMECLRTSHEVTFRYDEESRYVTIRLARTSECSIVVSCIQISLILIDRYRGASLIAKELKEMKALSSGVELWT